MGRDRYARQSLGTLHNRIKEARVLLVGAGGIGCELLKNLVLTGFGEIHVVDLDTIDLSNLNRQFLFRQEHIKKSKALVAKATAGKFNPHVKIEAQHANIKDPDFGLAWFGGFNVVFNALDNLDARRHVNKMCLAADVPLIESGTTGFNGQVQVIRKGKTECYDCNTKESPKSFPVCTIRSTPSQPIHCIVWAKSYLFTEIFGTSEDDAPELDHSEDSENAKEIASLRQESQALKRIRASMGSPDFARQVFNKVFTEDIERLRGMEDMWRSRKAPDVLHYDNIKKEVSQVESGVASKDQSAWSLLENLAVFEDSLHRLSTRLQHAQAQTSNGDAPAILTFDKDDEDTLDFVAASANLRSIVFGIPPRSKFDIKQMAGNIIPAIATTNAVIAGLCVLQSFKVMRDNLNSARMIFLTNSESRILTAEPLRPPNPSCPSCSVAHSSIDVDLSRATLKDLVEDVLRARFGYGEEFSVNNEIGTLYDPELDDNLDKKFSELGIRDGSFLTIVDEDDSECEPRVNLVLAVVAKATPEAGAPIVAEEKLDIPRKPIKAAPTEETNGQSNGVVSTVTNGIKRKRSAGEAGLNDEEAVEEQQLKKRGKVYEESAPDVTSKPAEKDGVILLDDDPHVGTGGGGGGSGAIVIDDD